MSLYDYKKSLEISAEDPPFASLIMSALRKADTKNLAKIKKEWPEIYDEFLQRYYGPGGLTQEEHYGPQTRNRQAHNPPDRGEGEDGETEPHGSPGGRDPGP